MKLEVLTEAISYLRMNGRPDLADAVTQAAVDLMETSEQKATENSIIIGGALGLIIGTVIIPGAWLPLGLAGALLGTFPGKKYAAAKAKQFKNKVWGVQ